MARITVEDCLENVENRFQLVMISSKRARQLQTGGKDPLVSVDNDKPTVLALREIADGKVDAKILTERPGVEMDDIAEELEAKKSNLQAALVEEDNFDEPGLSSYEDRMQQACSEMASSSELPKAIAILESQGMTDIASYLRSIPVLNAKVNYLNENL